MGHPMALQVDSTGASAVVLPIVASHVAVGGSWLYITAVDWLVRVPLGGGAALTLATGIDSAGLVAVDGTGVYVAGNPPVDGSAYPPATVFRVPLEGGTPVAIATEPAGISALASGARAFADLSTQPGSTCVR